MIRAVWFLILLGAIAWGAAMIADTPSKVTLDWLGYRVETTMGVLFALIVALGLAFAILYRLWSLTRTAPSRFRRARQERRRERGYRALTQGMVAVAAGDAVEARRQARRAEKLLAEPPLTMLLSAQAAQLSGDDAAADKFFEAMSEQKETRYLGLRGRLNRAMEEGDSEAALELAEAAAELKPKTDSVAETLFDLQIKEGRWAEAEETVRKAVRNKTLDADVGRRRRAVLIYERSLEAEAEGKLDDALALAKRSNSLAPRFVPAALRVASLLAGAGKRRRAASALEESWVVNPHPRMVDIMEGLANSDNPQEKLRMLERLAGNNRDHDESQLALAEAALKAGMTREAREHLDAVDGDDPPARKCRLMAELAEAEGDAAGARDWLRRASTARPDSQWVCDNCGTVIADWTPVCERCRHFDSYEWTTPPRVTRYSAAADSHAGETLESDLPDGSTADPATGPAPDPDDGGSPEAAPEERR